MLKNIILTGFLMVPLAACATWETSNIDNNPPEAAVAAITPGEVHLTSAAFDPATQTKISDLKVSVNKTTAFHPEPTVEHVEQKLREEAAKIGADTVVDTKITGVKVTPFSWGTRVGTGTAVRVQ